MAHLDGSKGTESHAKIVPLALARLEKMIESRLDESGAGGEQENWVRVKVFEPDDASDGLEASDLPMEPEFYEGIVDRIMNALGDELEGQSAFFGAAKDEDLPEGMVRFPSSFEPEMPPQCDFIVANLKCHHCGVVSRDASTHCETFLSKEPQGRDLRVGDSIGELDLSERPEYYQGKINSEDVGHVLEGWECPSCANVNWAEVVLDEGVIRSVWSVELNRVALERADLISSECVELAAHLCGRPPWTLLGDDIVAILCEHL